MENKNNTYDQLQLPEVEVYEVEQETISKPVYYGLAALGGSLTALIIGALFGGKND